MLAQPFDENAKDKLIEHAGQCKYVLLGEASHGTSEYYTVRAELTKRLIAEHGFRFIAVEGDWPSCYTLNRYVKGYANEVADAREALRDFQRWPTWMWANREVAELAEWLRQYNADKADQDKVGFYGIDVYSLWESMDEILKYLEAKGSEDLETAKRAFDALSRMIRTSSPTESLQRSMAKAARKRLLPCSASCRTSGLKRSRMTARKR